MSHPTPNVFVPFPIYENAVFIGDSAIEALSVLKIYGKALIGGELPNMHLFHPYEKLLECTHCVMNDKKMLLTAIRRGEIDYVLLENNPSLGINPFDMKEELEKQNVAVKVLDIKADPKETLRLAGALYNEQKRAQRAITEFERLEDLVNTEKRPDASKVLSLLCIRHPVDERCFIFALSDESDISKEIYPYINAINPIHEKEFETVIPGLVEIHDIEKIMNTGPDSIVLLGDYLGSQLAISHFVGDGKSSLPPAIKEQNIFSLPYYDKPLAVKKPKIIKKWLDTFRK